MLRQEPVPAGLAPRVPAGHLAGAEEERHRVRRTRTLGLSGAQVLHETVQPGLQPAGPAQQGDELVPIETAQIRREEGVEVGDADRCPPLPS